MAEVSVTGAEMERLMASLNGEFDRIDRYPGDLDPHELGRAADEAEALRSEGGQGQLTPRSAKLAADVLALGEAFGSEMQATVIADLEATIAKLREASTAFGSHSGTLARQALTARWSSR